MTALPALIRTERVALIEFLESLSPPEWATPSLCGDWTVQEVAAHLAWAPAQPAPEMALGLVRAGLRVNRLNSENAVRWARRGTGVILDQLRANAESGAKPTGVPRVAALGDAVVHALDIRRPLGRPRAIPEEAFRVTADFFAGARWPLTIVIGGSVRRRIAGLRLVADGGGWSHGQGPEVHGSPEALMLMLAGRPVASSELTGPGAPDLLARLGPAA